MNNKKKALDLINAYLEKQNKTKLAAEKIELADFADIDTQIKRAEKLNQEIKEHADRIYSAKQNASEPARKAVDLSDRIVSELKSDKDKFIQRVKKLGIDPNELSQPKNYDKAISRCEALAKNISKMYNTDIK
jgi:DNA repair exonuclease SbcCD ATPase subunit